MSKWSGQGDGSLAVDGNNDATWLGGSCAAVGKSVNPWWAVDLGSPTTVIEVEITNAADAFTGTTQLLFTKLVCKYYDLEEYVPESNEQTSHSCSGFVGFSAI